MATDLTSTYPCPECPEDCGAFVMPVFNSEDCIDTITSELSEIKRVFLAEFDPSDKTKPLGGPADWTLKADWEAAISNTTTGKVRSLHVIADVGEAEKTTRVFHDNKSKVVNRAYPITIDVLDLNQENYDAMRSFQCGGDVRMWFLTRGNYLYGGQDGIPMFINDADSLFERGADAYKKIVIKGIYNALCAPDRTPSPWGEPSITP